MKRLIKRTLLGSVALLLLVSLAVFTQVNTGNFHQVLRGELYRSAQPDAADLAAAQRDHEIKTVINLRGGNEGDAWYREEIEASKKLGLNHIDFRMKASRELTDQQALELVEVMRTAPKPILIHCKSGADRTGLATALYLRAIKGLPDDEADKQLSLYYGHMFFPWSESQAMDRTYERVAPKLAPVH